MLARQSITLNQMKLYVLIQSCDNNGEGYWQDSIAGIYQAEADAKQALAEAIANEPVDGNYGCVLYVQWGIQEHYLIHQSN